MQAVNPRCASRRIPPHVRPETASPAASHPQGRGAMRPPARAQDARGQDRAGGGAGGGAALRALRGRAAPRAAPPAAPRPAGGPAPPRRADQLRARHVGACRRSRRPQWSCRRTRRAGGGCWATPAASPAARTPRCSAPPSAASWSTRMPGWVRRGGGEGGAGRAAPRSPQASAVRLLPASPRACLHIHTRVSVL